MYVCMYVSFALKLFLFLQRKEKSDLFLIVAAGPRCTMKAAGKGDKKARVCVSMCRRAGSRVVFPWQGVAGSRLIFPLSGGGRVVAGQRKGSVPLAGGAHTAAWRCSLFLPLWLPHAASLFQDHSPEDCPVCLEAFDDTEQRPHTLPCGHTLCTLCVNRLIYQGQVTCPECRVSHAVPEGGQFPISYAVEALIRRMRDVHVAATARPPPPSAGKITSKILSGFLQQQEATMLAAITTCQRVQSQLDQYLTSLSAWREQQQQVNDTLQAVLDQSRSAMELVEQEESRAVEWKEEAKKGEEQLQAMLETLHTITTEQEAGGVLPELLRCTGKAKEVEDCQENFPDVDVATTMRKVSVPALHSFSYDNRKSRQS